MNKPDYISFKDWELLSNKYSSKKLEEYFNRNYPYQYLIGNVDFCNNQILIDERVLIPRFETEILVFETLKVIKQLNFIQPNIVDICTGSGCIAISLKKAIDCQMTAIDVSKEAIDLAQENAKLNKVDIKFIENNVLTDNNKYTYDIVISNPPYISFDEIVGKSTKYEPQIALFSHNNGLIFYEEILKKYNAKLYSFEIGANQKEQVINIARKYFPQAKIISKQDFSKFDRYIFIINE